jgi:uncharacterized protein YndB with AHSA1/START domain
MNIDTNAELAAVTRSLGRGVRDGVQVHVLTVERRYAEPADQVWSAITESDRIGRWLAPVEGDLRLGGHFQIEGNAGGTVLACEPTRSLSITWEFGGHTSYVDVTLEDSPDEGTLLRLVHSAPSDPEHWEEYGPGAVGIGWELALVGLEMHLADPSAGLPDPESLGDLTPMFTGAGQAWREATEAAGHDPEWAAAAARRCIAAYSGTA